MDWRGMTLPIVGVTGSRSGGRAMRWFNWLSLRMSGLRPLRIVPVADDQVLAKLDGLVIGGGDNIGAELYRGVPVPGVRIDPDRDRLELAALDYAAPRGLPILGVCRGAQMLNVFYGGSLHSNIYETYPKSPKLWTPLPRKQVEILSGTQLHAILNRNFLHVNSLHRQSVDRVGDGLRICAKDEYGIIQGIEDPASRFRLGVQWHPEFLIYRPPHRRLFNSFAEAVHNYRDRCSFNSRPGGSRTAKKTGFARQISSFTCA
jgi:putative glutamine amidotransferase